MNQGDTPANVGSMEGLGSACFETTMRQWCPEHWTFESDGCGGYHNHHTELAWIAWQAAREQSALACERVAEKHLNSGRYVSVIADHSTRAGGQVDGAEECAKAIRAA
jgi:hypothetical protein